MIFFLPFRWSVFPLWVRVPLRLMPTRGFGVSAQPNGPTAIPAFPTTAAKSSEGECKSLMKLAKNSSFT